MDDIFSIDDTEVDVVSRSRATHDRSVSLVDDGDEYTVPENVIDDTRVNSTATNHADADAEEEDEFRFDYLPPRSRAKSASPKPFDLGLDEEVVIKRRVPQAKLDDERLLGPLGIPKIRDDLRKKIRFRGKGHELQDLGRFIEQYQFWAHELFPKAKFRDALRMIGKVGKTRRMRAQRRQIITDLLPRPVESLNGDGDESELEVAAPVESQQPRSMNRAELGNSVGDPVEIRDEDLDMSDYEDDRGSQIRNGTRPVQGLQGIANDIPDEMPMEESDDMDDMDALEAMGVMV